MEPIDEPYGQTGAEAQGLAPPIAEPASPKPTSIAPVWHTVLLILGILAVSLLGVYRHPGGPGVVVVNRLHTYGVTAGLEVVLMGWVAFGLRLRGMPFRSLLGKVSGDFRSIAVDVGIAILFWMGSLMALATLAMMWMSIEAAITHRPIPIPTGQSGRTTLPNSTEDKAARAVVQLAPENGQEIACWLLLCMLVGVAEELVFRGYLQQQFTAWTRGATAGGVVFSAVMFGAAHGYEGARAMFLLAVFGALFSLLALFRRNLRAGIFAHTWHDALAGLTVAFLHSRHVL
ncbi:MAG: CPBP family intramembrane glutamic endopeptidase [Terracidiphilus sp.]